MLCLCAFNCNSFNSVILSSANNAAVSVELCYNLFIHSSLMISLLLDNSPAFFCTVAQRRKMRRWSSLTCLCNIWGLLIVQFCLVIEVRSSRLLGFVSNGRITKPAQIIRILWLWHGTHLMWKQNRWLNEIFFELSHPLYIRIDTSTSISVVWGWGSLCVCDVCKCAYFDGDRIMSRMLFRFTDLRNWLGQEVPNDATRPKSLQLLRTVAFKRKV